MDNTTESSQCDRFSMGGTITLGILLYVVSIVTIIGNILVISSFLIEKQLRSFGNYFIVNLSIADLIIGILMSFYIPYFITGCWDFTRPGCILFNVVDYAVPLASTWNIALISLDRYWSVTRAIQYRVKQSKKRAMLFMMIPWIIGFIFYGPAVIGWEHWTGRQKVPEDQCFVEFFDNVPYLLFMSVVEFIVPFIFVFSVNIMIYVNIRRRARGAVTPSVGRTGNGHAAILSRDRKTARSLAILVGIFLLTWAPYEICTLINPLCNFCVPTTLFDVVFWLLWINSTINPLIYALLQVKFRDSFIKILRCRYIFKKNTVHPMKKCSDQNTTSM